MTVAAETFPFHSSRSSGGVVGGVVDRAKPSLVIALGFLCFMPYPALSIGNASALQIGNVLTVLALIVCGSAAYARQKLIYLFPLILAPLVLSSIKAAVSDAGQLDLCFKSIALWGVAGLTLVAVQIYAPRYGLQLLIGIAVATLVHTAVGIWQLYSFGIHEFPMPDLYINQSFTSVTDNAFIIANYIQRPFGIFPEPSAMSSSLAPWILIWVAEMCGIIRFRQQPTRPQRILFFLAAAGGIALIIMSQSGHTVATLAALTLFGIIWLTKARATRRTFGIVATVFGLVLPLVLWWGVTTMSDRIGGEWQTPNSSWDERSSSLAVGFSLWAQGDPATVLFGLGAGFAPIAVLRAAGLDAVWSVLLTYVYESGLFGALTVLWIGTLLLRIWRTSGWNIAFITIALAWLFGITFITSYGQLLPIWVTLGWLTVWPSVCLQGAAEPVQQPLCSPARRRLWPESRPYVWTARPTTES